MFPLDKTASTCLGAKYCPLAIGRRCFAMTYKLSFALVVSLAFVLAGLAASSGGGP